MTEIHKTHKIKLAEQFCGVVDCGIKTFEIRKDDRDYNAGDFVQFIPVKNVNGEAIPFEHPVSKKTFEIEYLIDGWGLKDGYVAFSIKEVDI